MDAPKVSIIIPLYQCGKYVTQCLQSVVEQTFTDWEILVTDDAGTDDGADRVLEFTDAHRSFPLTLLRHEANRGVSAARNTALIKARGRWVAFLDADDEWMPHHLTSCTAVAEMQRTGVIYGGMSMFRNEKRNVVGHWSPAADELATFPDSLYARNFLAPSASLLHRSCFENFGRFNEDPLIQSCEDHDYFLRLAKHGVPFHYLGYDTVFYRLHEESATSRRESHQLKDIRVLRQHLKSTPEKRWVIRRAISKGFATLGEWFRGRSWGKAVYYYLWAWFYQPLSFAVFRSLVSVLRGNLSLKRP